MNDTSRPTINAICQTMKVTTSPHRTNNTHSQTIIRLHFSERNGSKMEVSAKTLFYVTILLYLHCTDAFSSDVVSDNAFKRAKPLEKETQATSL
jgi:hypothetical protein